MKRTALILAALLAVLVVVTIVKADDRPVYLGFNALPWDGEQVLISSVVAGNPCVSVVWRWDSSSQTWNGYDWRVRLPGELTHLFPGEVYLVHWDCGLSGVAQPFVGWR